MSGINPQGCQVVLVQGAPSEDLDHDFLWRTATQPARARAHRHLQPLVLRGGARRARAPRDPREAEAAARRSSTKRIWKERYEDIAAYERYLARNGVADPEVLPARLEGRAEEALPRADRRAREELEVLARRTSKERAHWKEYMAAYEDMIRATAAPHAPWFVVPADKKWFTRLVVAGAVADAMDRLGLAFPSSTRPRRRTWSRRAVSCCARGRRQEEAPTPQARSWRGARGHDGAEPGDERRGRPRDGRPRRRPG